MKRIAAIFCALFAGAAASADTMLVFDASNSMWGEIDGTDKIEIARDAVDTLLDEWLPAEPLGLMVYGHREPRSCTDIELISKPGATFGTIRKALRDVRPNGKTPLTGALLEASRTLIDSKAPNPTIVLVTDGVETCEQDPCTVARLLKNNNIDFTAHVIGFDLDGDEFEKVECIAEETGGLFIEGSDDSSLREAMEIVAAEISEKYGSSAIRTLTTDTSASTLLSALAIAPDPELEALLAEGARKQQQSQSAKTQPRAASDIGPDGISRRDPSRVLQEKSREQVAQSLVKPNSGGNAGSTTLAYGTAPVTFVTRLAEGRPTEVLFDRVQWTVYERNSGRRGDVVAASMATFPTFELSAGDYVTVLEAENVTYSLGFVIDSTLPRQFPITLNLGRLDVSVENLDMVDVYAFRFERGPDNPSIDLTVRGPWEETFLLPKGTYIVQGRSGNRRQTVGPLVLEPGDTATARIEIR